MVVLIQAAAAAGSLDPVTASALARLGITTVTVVEDEAETGFVLEGWAFDPLVGGEQAAALVSGSGGPPRVLYPLLQAAVSTKPEEMR